MRWKVLCIAILLTEWVFIIISLLVAGIGIGLGVLFYVKNPRLPDVWAQRLKPLYQASYNKYWVDEFYGWAVTRRVMDLRARSLPLIRKSLMAR